MSRSSCAPDHVWQGMWAVGFTMEVSGFGEVCGCSAEAEFGIMHLSYAPSDNLIQSLESPL